jgi:hypothetical protein
VWFTPLDRGLTSAECRQSGPGMLAFGLVAVS